MRNIAVFFCLLINAFSSGYLITTGDLFMKMTGKKGVIEKPIINPQFFRCGALSSCLYIGKKGEIARQLSAKDAEINKNNFEIWKKMKSQFKDCKDIYDYGIRRNGEYIINPKEGMQLTIYCDMESGGGGWVVIQRRIDDKIDFQRNWHDYKHGFGELNGNLWIGLENMHILAGISEGAILRIKMKHWQGGNVTYYANYCNFTISDEKDGYRVSANGYWGTAGDPFVSGMVSHNGMRFSTKDVDNDRNPNVNCALDYKGGWWYNRCHSCHLNGLYPKDANGGDPTYISWWHIGYGYGNIYYSEMEVTKKSNFSPVECVT